MGGLELDGVCLAQTDAQCCVFIFKDGTTLDFGDPS